VGVDGCNEWAGRGLMMDQGACLCANRKEWEGLHAAHLVAVAQEHATG
jgi:hypothetical protein